ncbi:MAG: 23S rRNA (guanosine(2251)-2'-O)-methyltransferase RlmB [Anaerolineae bacterium]
MREILYGRQPVRECLRARRRHIYHLILAQGVSEKGIVAEILDLAAGLRLPQKRVARSQLDQVAKAHQGVALEVTSYPYTGVEDILRRANRLAEQPLVLALDHLQDPHNLGALLRTAEVAGAHGAIIPRRRSVDVTPAVVSASAGACEHLQIAQVTNLVRTLEDLKAEGLWIVGLENHPDAQPYHQVDLNLPLVLVVGGEGQGLSRLVRETCDLLVRLPMHGQTGSLNASVAGGIALYAALAARGFSAE